LASLQTCELAEVVRERSFTERGMGEVDSKVHGELNVPKGKGMKTKCNNQI